MAGGCHVSSALAASTFLADANVSSATDATALAAPSEYLLSHFNGKDTIYSTVAAACGIAMRASLRAARHALEEEKERRELKGKERSGKEHSQQRAEPAAEKPLADAAHEIYSAALAKMLSAEGRDVRRGAGTPPSHDRVTAAELASPVSSVMDSITRAAVMALAQRSLRAIPLLRACARPSKPSQWRPAMWQLASGSGGFGVLRLGPAEAERLLLKRARSLRRSMKARVSFAMKSFAMKSAGGTLTDA